MLRLGTILLATSNSTWRRKSVAIVIWNFVLGKFESDSTPFRYCDSRNNTIESVLGSAISLGSNTESVEIRDNSFDNIIPVDYLGSPLAIGIQAELANGLEISGNSYSNLLQSNSLVNCTNVSIQQNTYENSSLMLLTTFPHSVEFLDAPWWSSALSFGGSELYEVFVNTPTDLTYQFGLSLACFLTRRPIPGAWMLLRAISIVKLFRMMALASFRQDVNYARVKRTVLEPSLT